MVFGNFVVCALWLVCMGHAVWPFIVMRNDNRRQHNQEACINFIYFDRLFLQRTFHIRCTPPPPHVPNANRWRRRRLLPRDNTFSFFYANKGVLFECRRKKKKIIQNVTIICVFAARESVYFVTAYSVDNEALHVLGIVDYLFPIHGAAKGTCDVTTKPRMKWLQFFTFRSIVNGKCGKKGFFFVAIVVVVDIVVATPTKTYAWQKKRKKRKNRKKRKTHSNWMTEGIFSAAAVFTVR